jgi:uroporphyrinogen decarboxylase
MTPRENLLGLFRRQGYEYAPVEFDLCPSLQSVYKEATGSDLGPNEYFGFPERFVEGPRLAPPEIDWARYFPDGLKEGTWIDPMWGIAHEPGSEAAKHMTYMRHPLARAQSIEEIQAYPFPDYSNADTSHMADQVASIHDRGLSAAGGMACTVWETSWYVRSMEELMMDMLSDDEKAVLVLDTVTNTACQRAASFARAGVDVLQIGDDVGMQSRIMMSEELYREWLKPRLARVIKSAKEIKPDIIVLYHSCGYVRPLINDLIEAGIDVLNPVQPECMDFAEIHEEFGDRLSFHGTIGTQTTMPFGTPEEVKKVVFHNLEIAGDKGGLLCAPTHLLEPEVPWQNVEAYVQACREFRKAGG